MLESMSEREGKAHKDMLEAQQVFVKKWAFVKKHGLTLKKSDE